MSIRYSILRRVLLLGAIGLVLSGCFQSDGPKFPPGTAAAPFGDGGRYVVYEYVAEDRYERQEVFDIKRRADRAYDLINEKGQTIAVTFHAVAEDRFVGQTKTEKDPNHKTYGYLMLRVTDKEALLYLPQCGEQELAVLDAFEVKVLNKLECSIDRVSDPVELFKALRLGHPVSKLVRE